MRFLALLILSASLTHGAIQIIAPRGFPIAASGGGGGGGLTILGTTGSAGSPNTQTATAGTTTTHAYTGLPANTFIVVTFAEEDAAEGAGATVTDTAGLTWTERADAGTGSNAGVAEVHTALFAAGGSTTITVTCSGAARHRSSVCYPISGAETVFGGAVAGTIVAGQSQPTLAITTTRANSLLICATSDWNAVATARTYRTPPTMTEALHHAPGNYTGNHFYGTATSATAYNIGSTAPTGQSAGAVAIEVRTP